MLLFKGEVYLLIGRNHCCGLTEEKLLGGAVLQLYLLTLQTGTDIGKRHLS